MERTLTARELNRTLLARQGLIERLDLPLPRALDAVGAIQAQYAPSMYVGLFARLAGFVDRVVLTRALEDRSVVQATLMRGTIHLVSREDYWPLALGTLPAARAAQLRARREWPAEEMEELARAVREALAEGGALARKDVEALAGRRTSGVLFFLDLVRAPPSGTWERRRADVFALAEDWLGPPPPDGARRAAQLLVDRRLRGFGPATRNEIANWAGVKVGDLKDTFAAMDLVEYGAAGGRRGEVLLDLPGLTVTDGDVDVPVRFLPTWDATLLVHCRRAVVLREDDRPKVFHVRNPHSVCTFLVDGVVCGTWRHEDGTIRVDPWRRLSAAERRAVDDEAERVLAFHS